MGLTSVQDEVAFDLDDEHRQKMMHKFAGGC